MNDFDSNVQELLDQMKSQSNRLILGFEALDEERRKLQETLGFHSEEFQKKRQEARDSAAEIIIGISKKVNRGLMAMYPCVRYDILDQTGKIIWASSKQPMESSKGEILLPSIVTLAHGRGWTTVAEGLNLYIMLRKHQHKYEGRDVSILEWEVYPCHPESWREQMKPIIAIPVFQPIAPHPQEVSSPNIITPNHQEIYGQRALWILTLSSRRYGFRMSVCYND